MNKLFDLRFVIGVFFAVVGLLILIYAFLTKETSQSVNQWCGGLFILFGMVMIFLSFQKDAGDELLQES